ncbi:MAG TPA: hypothetical protein VER83_01165 [Candidatus Nanopelagicales bacterium]|jgi:hypothetical protein|nr:hypothetical protein [Candidatus Nanopelagicales bacterium]
MTKRSKHERAQRVVEADRVRQIQAAWAASTPANVAREFEHAVQSARARGPLPPRPDMAPGTLPNPPRPGHEPKPPKDVTRTRRPR